MKLRTDDILDVLDTSGQLFARFTKERYLSLVDEYAWGSLMRVGVSVLHDDYHEVIMQLALPPAFEVMESTHNNLFIGGMPLAALPIESLYQVWSNTKDSPFGRTRGLYHAESALHVKAICEKLGGSIPQEYQACPDHLVILLDLVALFLEAGNRETAEQIVRDHLSWLDSYAAVLKERISQVASIDAYTDEHRTNLEEGILFYHSLVLLVSQVLQEFCRQEVSLPANASEATASGQDTGTPEATASGQDTGTPEQDKNTFEQTTNNKIGTREVMHV